MKLDPDTVVRKFLELARDLQSRRLTGAESISEIVAFYRDVRVEGCDETNDEDMLLVQWGEGRHLMYDEPVDLRRDSVANVEEPDLEEEMTLYFELTRKVFIPGGRIVEASDEDFDSLDGELDFQDEFADCDDLTIHLSLCLIYGSPDRDEGYGNFWSYEPWRVEKEMQTIEGEPLVSTLMAARPHRILAIVTDCE